MNITTVYLIAYLAATSYVDILYEISVDRTISMHSAHMMTGSVVSWGWELDSRLPFFKFAVFPETTSL